MPPPTTHRQQQRLPADMIGSAESTPIASPPNRAGWVNAALVVVLTAEMGDQLLTLQVPQRVLQFHQLNEQIVFGVQSRRVDGALEVKREPLLDAVHPGALGEIEEQ